MAGLLLVLASCSGTKPGTLGLTDSGLAPCPASPNCVSSNATDSDHGVAPLILAVAPEDGWRAAREAVSRLPRTRIVVDTGSYLHAECSSALLGFVDDLELHLPGGAGAIAVRSASRLGYSDMGVNRRRVDELRSDLQRSGTCAR
ncbi:MAG: DUF1499 domain-containing protein [Candidatus Binatia bacterium]